MQVKIGKTYSFEAGHHLPFHDGKCSRRHGHRYTLTVEVCDALQTHGSQTGMVLDYGALDILVKFTVINVLDHRDLNSTDPNSKDTIPGTPLAYLNGATTAENLVLWCASVLQSELDSWNTTLTLTKVRLQESPDSYAEVTLGKE